VLVKSADFYVKSLFFLLWKSNIFVQFPVLQEAIGAAVLIAQALRIYFLANDICLHPACGKAESFRPVQNVTL
jgi:hypothetical protein